MLEVFLMADSSPNIIIHPLSQAELWGGPGILRWYWSVPKCSASSEQVGPWVWKICPVLLTLDQRPLSLLLGKDSQRPQPEGKETENPW